MTKIDATRKLRGIYKVLANNQAKVQLNKKLKPLFGQVIMNDSGYKIELNPNKSGKSFICTVIHECLHAAYWQEHEKTIGRWEKEMFRLLSDRQLTNLMKRLFSY